MSQHYSEDNEIEEGELEDDETPYEEEGGLWNATNEGDEEIDFTEKWDDSALIEAWDSAVREYQKYHSGKATHTGNPAKRRRVKSQTSRNEEQTVPLPTPASIPALIDQETQQKDSHTSGLTPEMISHESATVNPTETTHQSHTPQNDRYENMYTEHAPDASTPHASWSANNPSLQPRCSSCNGPRIPTDDEDLSNMMMAWYYAGYYSGIYTSKRKRES
ncbi:hypothetical protein HDV00_000301 [Rhizophlyctis rosea]|nr:hypothetical protein HDV00_000301 [Rhizophlyctis rosea]